MNLQIPLNLSCFTNIDSLLILTYQWPIMKAETQHNLDGEYEIYFTKKGNKVSSHPTS